MKLTINREVTGRFGIAARTGEYDGYAPVSELWMDKAPRSVSSDRLAVAAVLAFKERLSGEIQFEEGISPATAEAITAFLSPVYVVPSPIQFRPLMLPKGNSKFVLPIDSNSAVMPENSVANARRILLDLRSSDQWAGSLMSFNSLTIASNESYLSTSDTFESRLGSKLAIGVLFAEDFDVDSFVVDIDISDSLRRLLAAARLGISQE